MKEKQKEVLKDEDSGKFVLLHQVCSSVLILFI